MKVLDHGTTSAHAENTPKLRTVVQGHGNYLRARGEYKCVKFLAENDPELPPRTRRIHRATSFRCLIGGTTSAHAENTNPHTMGGVMQRNYLRARGEYKPTLLFQKKILELPPRTRRIRIRTPWVV